MKQGTHHIQISKDQISSTKSNQKVKTSREVKEVLRDQAIERWQDLEYREWVNSRQNTSVCKKIMREMAIKRWQNPVYRNKTITKIKEGCSNLEFKKMTGQRVERWWQESDHRERRRNEEKERWRNPGHAKKCLHRRIPSGPEQMFIDLNLPFRFVGNGKLDIDGKNPDFVGIQNDHKLIEIWGEHFKLGRNPQDLVDFYKVRGYDCLVIWASELRYSEEVVMKIKSFISK